MAKSPKIIGLPLNPLESRNETLSARKARLAALDALVRRVFLLSKFHLGEDNARKLFKRTAQLKKGKHADADKDFKLLRLWDALLANNPHMKKAAPGLIARKLYKTYGNEFGASAQAIERKIRRELNKRKFKDAAALRLNETFRTMDGTYAGLLTAQIMESLKKRLERYPGPEKRMKKASPTPARTRKSPD